MTPVGPDTTRLAGNRRRRIRIAAVTAAALTVIAAPVIAYALVPRDSTPEVASSPAPATTTAGPTLDVEPADVPAAAALQQSDVPAGYQYVGDDIDGDWTLEFMAQFCAPPNNLDGVPSSVATRGAAFQTGSGPESRVILQKIDRYTVAEAQAYVQAVRRMAQACVPRYASYPMTWTIAGQGFAGDDALSLTWPGGGSGATYVVVRAGGLVTQIWYKDTNTPDPVLLGQRAAARLCEGTNAC